MKLTTGQVVIAVLVMLAFFGMLALFVFYPEALGGAAKEPLILISGAMIGAFGMIVQWFFGSSKSSADKTAALYRAGIQTGRSEPTPVEPATLRE